ncbi:MAG: hypothetical protein ACLFVU_13840, partial [Phycisphaerae bacterium]
MKLLNSVCIAAVVAVMLGSAASAVAQSEEKVDKNKRLKIHAGEKKLEADTLEKITKPTDWLSWGADLRLREVYLDNPITLNDHASDPPGDEWH